MKTETKIYHEYTLSGYLVLSAIIGLERFSLKFQGFELDEAKEIFKQKFNI